MPQSLADRDSQVLGEARVQRLRIETIGNHMVDRRVQRGIDRNAHRCRLSSRIGNGNIEVAKLRVLDERNDSLKSESAVPRYPFTGVRKSRAKRSSYVNHRVRH